MENPVCSGVEVLVFCTGVTNLFGSISTIIKNKLLSADVRGFGFDEFDDGGDGFNELLEIRPVWVAFHTKRNMPRFWKPVFISATAIDSPSCLKNVVELVLQQLIDSFHQVLQALGFGWSY